MRTAARKLLVESESDQGPECHEALGVQPDPVPCGES
jgi:hypothetical protein